MSVQEAAAVAVPAVGSDKIPFVVEYLLGDTPVTEQGRMKIGRGGSVAPSDGTDAFVQALDYLLGNEKKRNDLGRNARSITVPYFTWSEMTRRLLDKMGVGYDE